MFREICLKKRIRKQTTGKEKLHLTCTAGPWGEESSAAGRRIKDGTALSGQIVNVIQKRGENLVITHSLLFRKSMLTLQ